jgi:hypothetical protein
MSPFSSIRRHSAWAAATWSASVVRMKPAPDGSRRAEKTGTPVEWVEEESYFFRLSAYGERLLGT